MLEQGHAALLTFSSALGLGLLIGLVRERSHPSGQSIAGLRTHALAALTAAVAATIGLPVFLVALAVLGLLAAVAYRTTQEGDPGLTGEIALVLTFVLGGLAVRSAAVAAGLAVVVAVLLYAKAPLHRLSRERLSEREVFDGLMLLASALVILPILPDRALGPLDVINPATLWKLVVLVMAVSALGHVALRIIGNRWGLPVAGFFAGYVSSTAAVIGFGQRARDNPILLSAAVSAALLANLASLSLCVPILWALSPALVRDLAPELIATGTVLLAGGLVGLRAGTADQAPPPTAETRMFRFGHALGFALVVAALMLASAALVEWIGPQGAMAAAIVSASVELHAAVATLGTLAIRGDLDLAQSQWLLLGLLAASLGTKSAIAWLSGGRAFGARVSAALLAALATGCAVALLS